MYKLHIVSSSSDPQCKQLKECLHCSQKCYSSSRKQAWAGLVTISSLLRMGKSSGQTAKLILSPEYTSTQRLPDAELCITMATVLLVLTEGYTDYVFY